MWGGFMSVSNSSPASALTRCRQLPSVKALDLSPAGMECLIAFGEGQRHKYLNSAPFPHLIIDNLFDSALLEDVLQDVKNLEHPIAKNFFGSVKKFATPDPQAMGPTAQRFLLDLCSARFCLFLEALTGIEGIIPDPHFEGGGVHEMGREGFLKMHTDFNWNKKLQLDRRLNMLIYLNHDWQDSWGGHLELWDSEMKSQYVTVPPVFNKTVIFSTTDYSYHGLPNPLACPEDQRRRSLAFYYYSNGRPADEVQFYHSTGTNYQERPGEVFLPPQKSGKKLAQSVGQPASYAQEGGRKGRKSRPSIGPSIVTPARTVTAKVKKTIKKSLPKPLLALYKAGKRSLRG